MFPFKEDKVATNIVIREFTNKVDEEELVWHRDREDRVLEVLEDTDWQFQFDNDIPFRMSKDENIVVPKGIYHRVIKGSKNLKLQILKYE